MINLNPGTNSICVIAGPNATQAQPYYTFSITAKSYNQNIVFSNSDNSWAPWYWNSFTVSVGTISNPAYGEIIAPGGEYEYVVYEMPYPNCLTMSLAIDIVDSGLMIINRTYSNTYNVVDITIPTINYNKNL
jgi:hypothetical protein